MILLIDIGNTHTHLGVGSARRVVRTRNFPTTHLFSKTARRDIGNFVGRAQLEGVSLCSVVPKATSAVRRLFSQRALVLSPRTVAGVGIDYPRPATIGADRLANAVAVKHHYGAPAVVVDFGTAVTFDVVNRLGNYVGGIIAPGLSAMTSYLHEKTALLPEIRIREIQAVVGKNTEEAMLIGAVHGYRGLIRELVLKLKRELKARHLPVVATGGYAKLMAARLPEITAVAPNLTLEGLRLVWLANQQRSR